MKQLTIISRISMFVLVMLCGFATSVTAQENDPNKSFRLVYVAQDSSMPLEHLLETLRDAYNHAMVEGPTIFYLANGNAPIVVKVNVKDDNRDDFEQKLLPSLQENVSRSVYGRVDKENIIKLLDEANFLDDTGELFHRANDLEFHVGENFFSMGNNEALIGALFFELNLSRYMGNGTFNINVFCPRSVDEGINVFGVLNPDGVNQKVFLRKY